MKSPTHLAALEYATFGWHVFPIEPTQLGVKNSGKRPLTDASLGLVRGKYDATTDAARIDEIWSRYPNANVAIACEPSKLVVLDVDVSEDKKGRESLAEFDAHLPETLTALTGGAGLHAVFRTDDGELIQRLGLRPGLDLIGKGYIVAAPSLHWTGKQYRWTVQKPPAKLPSVLREAAGTRRESVQPIEKLERGHIQPGGRNVALYRLGATLRDSGIGKEALASALHWENQQRCMPPLADDELRLIIDSVLKRVTPSRDVAAGAVINAELKALFEPEPAAMWISEVAKKPRDPMRFYSTGFEQLDVLLGGGLATRQVCGVIGPPSAGKSAFVNCLVETLQQQIPVLHVSTELPREEVFVRYAALKLGFPWREGMKGLVPHETLEEATKALRIIIIGSDNIDRTDPLGQIRREASRLREQTGVPPGIIVDYVQMLARGSDDKHSKVGELTMGLRVLSQDLDCPLIAVFSSRRDFYGGEKVEKLREGDDPTAYLVAAKESGDIEFDCATLLYLDVDKNWEGMPKPGRIAIARCRVGDVGFVGVRAALDVGRWTQDASATAEFNRDIKGEERRASSLERDALRILELVDKMPGRQWREIRLASGMARKADIARARLVEMNKLEVIREVFYDTMQRRQTREIMKVIRNTAPPSVVPSTQVVQ